MPEIAMAQAAPPVSPQQQGFRDAMAQLAAAVNIVTTDGLAGRAGFTATAVCSVTDEPPTLLVCMNRRSRRFAAFAENGVLCVNVLDRAQAPLSDLFARKDMALDDCFAAADWRGMETGSPALEGAAVSLDCRIVQITEVGTHGVFLCEVTGLRLAPRPGALVWHNRAYVPIEAARACCGL
jgi:flavin reductase